MADRNLHPATQPAVKHPAEDDEEENEEEEEAEEEERAGEEPAGEEAGDDGNAEEAEEGNEEEDEEDEEDEEEEDLVVVKLSLPSDNMTRILKVAFDTTFKQFEKIVREKMELNLAGSGGTETTDLSIYYQDAEGDRIAIEDRKSLKHAFNAYYNGSENFLRVIVQPKQRRDDTLSMATVVTPVAVASPAAATVTVIDRRGSPSTPESARRQLSPAAMGAADRRGSSPASLGVPSTGQYRCPTPVQTEKKGVASELKIPNTACAAHLTHGAQGFDGLEQGQQIPWTRVSLLGKGSYGSVYEGVTADGFLMAIKVITVPPSDVAESTEIKSVMREINLMRSLSQANIVGYYGCQVRTLDDGTLELEIFLELCHGGSLTSMRKKLEKSGKNKAMPMALVRTYTRQILEGLRYLHSKGVIHRDIKPDNVLIAGSGEAKLADFGCSKCLEGLSLSSKDKMASLAKTSVGTPLFMAPEVINPTTDKGYTFAADIWSVGCCVIEMLGNHPWGDDSAAAQYGHLALMFKIASSKDMPTGIPRDTPPDLMNFFQCCFNRDPDKRMTAEELLAHPWITSANVGFE